MKMMKKIATIMLSICLIATCFSMSAFAADGKIMFTDPETKAGETVEVTGVVQKTSGNFGKIEIVMKYDTSMLKFKSGNGITESEAGTITYSGDATNDTGDRKEFVFSFTALKEGTTKIEIKDATIKNVSGTVLDYTKGSSTIKIAAGEGNTTTGVEEDTPGAEVEINGVTYVISNNIPEADIPEGYEAATLEYDQVDYNVVYSESFNLYLAYMIDEEMAGSFFMYVEEDATFAPYEEVEISDDITIALLSNVSEVVLPDKYEATEVLLNEHEFPAWRDKENPDYYILYAINNYDAEPGLYQLDNVEGTYQRFIQPEVVEEIEKSPLLSKLSSLLENHLDYVILGTGLGFLLFLLIIVILSVKLYNRNAELDEIYDEYGIGDEKHTEDDVVLELDDEEDDDDVAYDSDDEYEDSVEEEFTEEELDEVTLLVQEGMRELTAQSPKEEEKPEESLGKALQEVVARQEENEESDDDDDDFFDNFSVDFIDLDD